MEQFEITNFSLEYDGIFHINFNGTKKPVYLTPGQLFKLFHSEGIKLSDHFEDHSYYFEPLHFKETVLILNGFKEDNGSISFMTSEAAETFQDRGLYLLDVSLK